MIRKAYIYALLCPDEQKVRYVGKSLDPTARYKQHIALADRPKDRPPSARHRWLEELKDRGLEPELAILEVLECGEDETRHEHDRRVDDAESRWIVTLAAAGHPLTNGNGYRKAEEARLMDDAWERGRKLAAALDVDPSELSR